MKPARRTKSPPHKTAKAYRELWRVVDGAVADALGMHPDYLATTARERTVRNSINKRVVGAVLGFAQQRRAV